MNSVNLAELKTELTTDPETLGYAGKTDAEATDLLNDADRNGGAAGPIPPFELWARFDQTEYDTAMGNAANRIRLQTLCGMDIKPKAPRVLAEIQAVFGANSDSEKRFIGTLAPFLGDDLRERKISRAEELGWRPIKENDVERARAL